MNTLNLYEPTVDDLWFKEKLLGDKVTMAYNHAYGGTLPFPKAKWQSWHDRWLTKNEGKRFYRYVRLGEVFIGEVACRLDEERRIWLADVIILAAHCGQGYGKKALELLCEAAKAAGIRELYDEIALDNPGINLFLNSGFSEVSRSEAAILVKKEL